MFTFEHAGSKGKMYVNSDMGANSKGSIDSPSNRTMAKSARARSNKTNKTRLRSKIFNPVEIQRNERLSAKLSCLDMREIKDLNMDHADRGLLHLVGVPGFH